MRSDDWKDIPSLRISERRTVELGSVLKVRAARGRWRVTRIEENRAGTAVLDVRNLSSGRIRYIHPEEITTVMR